MAKLPALNKQDSWKREPWLLLVIGGPFCVVCASLFTGYLAFSGADKVVADDYYKQGMMINIDLMRDAKAREQKLRANLSLQPTGQLQVQVQGEGKLPDIILLSIATADAESALVETSRRLPLQQVSPGLYEGKLESTSPAVMHVKLETSDWRLTGDWRQPLKTVLQLKAVS